MNLEKLLELNNLLKEYNHVLKKADWTNDYIEEVKNEITYHSNKIEGLTLTYGETINFLKYGLVEQEISSKKLKDLTSLSNHRRILDQLFDNYQKEFITSESIKAIHKELLKESVSEFATDPLKPLGEFKQEINGTIRIVNGKQIFHEYLAPILVPAEIEKLLTTVNSALQQPKLDIPEAHPVSVAVYFHWKFLEIHPFYDGNGRLSRIYSNIILMKAGFPAVVIKGEEKDRESYIKALINSSSEDLSPIFDLFYEALKDAMLRGISFKG